MVWPFDATPAADPTDAGAWGAGPSVAANAPADTGGGWGMFSPGSLFTNPDFRRHAAFDALTNAGLSLIAASAPSPHPKDFGTMFGALAGGAAQGVQGSAERYTKMAQAGMQMRNMQMQAQMYPAALKLLQGGSKYDPYGGAATPQPTGAGPGVLAQSPAGGGVNDNNIGNVRPPGASTGFQQPPDFDSGVALAVKTAQSYPAAFNGGQPMNLVQIGEKWAPKGDGDNDPKQWAVNVSQFSGLPLNQPINLADPQVAAAFARGVHGAEKGAKAVRPMEAYTPGVSVAFGGAPASAQGDSPQVAPGGPPPVPLQPPPDAQPPVQLAQAGPQPGMPVQPPQMPGPPPGMPQAAPQAPGGTPLPPIPLKAPDPSKYAGLTMLGGPWAKVAETLQKADEAKYKAAKDLYDLSLKGSAEQRAQHAEARAGRTEQRAAVNADILPSGEVNPAKIGYAAQAELAKKKAESDAHEQSVFGGANWATVPPEQFRKLANPQVIQLADALQSGQTRLSTLGNRVGAAGVAISKADVLTAGQKLYGDQFNPDAGDIRFEFEKNAADTSHQLGKTLYSINTSYKHLNTFQDLVIAQQNKDTPVVNTILKAWNDQRGTAKYTSAEALQHALGTEIAAVIKGQQLNMPEVDSAIDTLRTTKSEPQMLAAVNVLRHAMGDRETTVTDAAARNYVPPERINKLIGPTARKAIDHFDQVQMEKSAAAEQAKSVSKIPLVSSPDEARKLGSGKSFRIMRDGKEMIGVVP